MEQKVIKIISKLLEVETNEIDLDTIIGDLPEWDSLHHLMIIKELEDEFNIKFSQEDLSDLEDVSDLIELTKEMIH